MSQQVRGFALIFFGGILWGLIGPLVKIMAACGSNPILTAFLRMSASFAIMLVIMLVLKGPSALRMSKRGLAICAALGVVSFALCSIVYNISITLSGVTTAVVLMSTAPVFGAIASFLAFREKITPKRVALYVLCVAGCMLVATGGKVPDGSNLIGVVCGLLSGICYSMTPIFARAAGEDVNPYSLNLYSFFFASLATLPFAQPWTAIDVIFQPQMLLAAFLLAALPSVLAYLLYYRGVELVTEVNLVPVFGTTEIIVGSLLGVLFFGDILNGASIAGMAVVLGTILALGVTERS